MAILTWRLILSGESDGQVPPPWAGIIAATDALRQRQAEMVGRVLPIIEARRTATEAWIQATAPLIQAGERIRAAMAALIPAPEVLEKIEWLRRDEARCDAIEVTGWMAHPSSPFRLVEENERAGDDLVQAVEDYYREEWDSVAAGMQSRVDACLIDDEAKATFAEALAAHGAGFFRCAPRLLFPELERVARKELHGGAMNKMASQIGLQEAVGSLTPMQMAWSGTAGLRFYRKLTEHMYANLRDEDAVRTIAADPVPNRHATVHGYVSYAAPYASFNAMAGTEYLFMAISALKAAAEEDASHIETDRR